MIKTTSDGVRYQTRFTNETHSAVSDTSKEKGGSESGFRPHDLLEAALATCINMSLRMYADHHRIPLSGVTTRVTPDRTHPTETIFEYEIELHGSLSQNPKIRVRSCNQILARKSYLLCLLV